MNLEFLSVCVGASRLFVRVGRVWLLLVYRCNAVILSVLWW